MSNYAFIDSQNLKKGVQALGWTLDFKRFRVYLKEKYDTEMAYLFLGFLPQNQNMYRALQEYGYILVFKQILNPEDGKKIKGNVDADLVLRAMIEFDRYDKAVLVTSDGDFGSLTEYLYSKEKLQIVLSPRHDKCSILLKKAAREKIYFLDNLRKKLELKKHR